MLKKEYSNGEVTITWEAEKCNHSGKCVHGLPEVFQPKEKPWIKIDAASTDRLVNQVKRCPSNALGYYFNNEKEEPVSSTSEQVIEVTPNGPLMVYGNIEVKYKDGRTEKKFKVTAFCRCGVSNNKPYCDGMHKKIGFEG